MHCSKNFLSPISPVPEIAKMEKRRFFSTFYLLKSFVMSVISFRNVVEVYKTQIAFGEKLDERFPASIVEQLLQHKTEFIQYFWHFRISGPRRRVRLSLFVAMSNIYVLFYFFNIIINIREAGEPCCSVTYQTFVVPLEPSTWKSIHQLPYIPSKFIST